ncbi:RluA family pseudouridine synthase [Pediococcus claussenii]|uniref:Pseudouridine synthase n=1 Tax=Pediococcus claussenii (strain ATCC BAA-344 / DSM 14800 / JCM 18046 / KCTC 3811 / LMG 21948 / P06) TaxID=701521 RepID=G8PEF6_PEDCP|nr:RluA family pseudouridine synthase [Pediococcus claussenii]AEV95565.1 pseudouridine synthase, RluA family [Pediococcus claussenii ATCC BAA-344]ANZ70904.1 RNA pseudouridine synthase [Pediococcus claussenii]KRN20201.1 hypothetical protein IV79_GL000868 [Pediococcus claussenii]
MRYKFRNDYEEIINAKRVLQKEHVSQRLIKRIEYEGSLVDENGTRIDFSDKLMPFEEFYIELPDEKAHEGVSISHDALSILFENDNWLVIDKDAGVSSVPGPSNSENTLVNRIEGHWQEQGSSNMVPHLVSRLDRDTSGIVLVAKNAIVNSLISADVYKKRIRKYYLAIVEGNLEQDTGIIDKKIGLAQDGIHREIQEDGQRSRTKFKVLSRNNGKTLVQVELLTGRTHQIRVHFAAINHPLIGDHLYGHEDPLIGRQALHASELDFFDPITKEERHFEAPLPKDFDQLKAQLGL